MPERSVTGSKGPRGHEARQPVDDRAVPWRVFLAVGAFVLVVGAIYWGTAYEESGTVMLIVAGLLSLWIAAYLWLQARTPPTGPREAVDTQHPDEVAHYLPHASVWPFAIGLGAATLANGLVLGVWLIVPGALLMVLGIAGFVRQTRRRD
ncbi:MAG TPA: cytochrome c oxidase subunit 4 [Acidimicrobiales bacterium]